MHATPKSASATTVAVDLAKDVFELAFADAHAHILERRRLTRTAFARAFDKRAPLRMSWKPAGRRTTGRGVSSGSAMPSSGCPITSACQAR